MPGPAASAPPPNEAGWSGLLRRWGPPLTSGLLFAAAFPPANLMLLAFVALVPWFRALHRPDPGYGFRSGLVFGLVFWLTQMAWVVPFVGRWTGSWAMALVPYLAVPVLGVWYFGLAGWAIQRATVRGRWWAAAPIWAAVEFLRAGIPELAFPWGFLATPLWTVPMLIQAAGLGTVFLVSAWVALANALGAAVLENAPRQSIVRVALVVVAGFMGSVARYANPPMATQTAVVGIGQLGEDLAFGDPATERARLGAAVRELRIQASAVGASMLVLPEGVSDGIDPDVLGPAGLSDVPILFGGQRTEGDRRLQSAFVVERGELKGVADKTRLVVFGERVPFRGLLGGLASSFRLPAGDLAAGDAVRDLEVAGVTVGPIICFEALFPDLPVRQAGLGARMIAVMSIDDWYMGTSAPEQLLAASAFRAAETGLPVVRSASLGVSGWFDARGNLRASAPVGPRTLVRAEVPLSPPGGDGWPGQAWIPWLLAAVAVGAVAIPARRS